MAPSHQPMQRRTGNNILAAAAAAAGAGRVVGKGRARSAGGDSVRWAAGGLTGAGRGGGQGDYGRQQPGTSVEPSESAVGTGALRAPRAPATAAAVGRVCPTCCTTLAPIPGVNMNMMKHCYACGGEL